MTLSNKNVYLYILGGLITNTSLLSEYDDICVEDFDLKLARIIFSSINALIVQQNYSKIDAVMVESEIEKHGSVAEFYKRNDGNSYLTDCVEYGGSENVIAQFRENYNILKKNALLRKLKSMHYDISYFYKDDNEIESIKEENELIERFNEATPEYILDYIEGGINTIRNQFLNGGRSRKDAGSGIEKLVEEFKSVPNVGPDLNGNLFNAVTRGAREGCFYLKSASGNTGKSRTSVFDACKMAYPEHYSIQNNSFVAEIDDSTGELRDPIKTLFIVTEMDETEIQTIVLAYLSRVNETHILTGEYEPGEEDRIKYAIGIMKRYPGALMIETISDPNLTNVSSTIKKYATIDGVKAVFFDYIHSTSSLLNQFANAKVREDVALMMLSNQLKQLAKDYHLFIFSATQVNADGMEDDGKFKNEMCIRGSKAISDKADLGYVMTRISEESAQSLKNKLGSLRRESAYSKIPNFVLDVYRNRRGQFKNVRIWMYLDLGTGEREDLFITNADNTPIKDVPTYTTYTENILLDWAKEV